MTEKCWNPDECEYIARIYRPGESHMFYGMRGAGKTHAAISFAQRLMEHYYEGTPEYVILLTNVIFLHRTAAGLVRETPPNVHTVTEMRQVFPYVADAIEKYGRKGLLIILLLDEAQNFLLGDLNSSTAVAMKQFCGILRKFQMLLVTLSPTMNGMGPAFRNFLDAPSEAGNLTCTFQKDPAAAASLIARKHYQHRQPRDFVYVKPGFSERRTVLVVPTSSWTRDPDIIGIGEYAYDTYASATFNMLDFPFDEFVRCVSNVSSLEVVKAIRDFYDALPDPETKTDGPADDGRMTEAEFIGKWYLPLMAHKGETVTQKLLTSTFGISKNTIKDWSDKWSEKHGGEHTPEGRVGVQDSEGRKGSGADAGTRGNGSAEVSRSLRPQGVQDRYICIMRRPLF